MTRTLYFLALSLAVTQLAAAATPREVSIKKVLPRMRLGEKESVLRVRVKTGDSITAKRGSLATVESAKAGHVAYDLAPGSYVGNTASYGSHSFKVEAYKAPGSPEPERRRLNPPVERSYFRKM